MGIQEIILNSSLHFAASAFVISGILLWLRRKSGDRARMYLFFICLFAVFVFGGRLLGPLVGVPVSNSILPFTNISGGLLTIIILYLYPIEVINPGWLNMKRGMLMLLPWVVVVLFPLISGMQFREIVSFGEIKQYISEPNIWFRLIIMLIILSYVVFIYAIPRQWMKSSATNKWITFYTLTVLCISTLWAIFMLTGSPLVSSLHLFFFILFCLGTTYQELFLRISVPARMEGQTPQVNLQEEPPTDEQTGQNPLWTDLCKLMKGQELWRNPDLTQEHLALLLRTNRTTLSDLFQEQGYSGGYKEYINRCRIADFLQLMDKHARMSIQDACFEAGYRSRMTAYRYFKEYMGVGPSEYLSSQNKDK